MLTAATPLLTAARREDGGVGFDTVGSSIEVVSIGGEVMAGYAWRHGCNSFSIILGFLPVVFLFSFFWRPETMMKLSPLQYAIGIAMQGY